MNKLGGEKSPYLLQHAGNPVDWYPWGEEAFRKAKEWDKPVFLSIGYSTCHWCHVMAEESFEDAELAGAFNRDFVCVKVDREERPDIDAAYMGAVQLMTGAGGWPLNVFLTPDKRPFYGGTYFTPGQLKQLLRLVAGKWKNEREAVALSAGQITGALSAAAGEAGEECAVTGELLGRAFGQLASQYDATFGGLGTAPKFPAGHNLSFLLLYAYRTGNKEALAMAENTLEHMAAGGLFDHVGGGFHRYSTDREWFLPHFEKMLYDQALLADAYLEAYQLTGRENYAETARRVFEYVLRDLAGPGGGFYCAEDADSATDAARPGEKTEGAYYVWTKDEISAALGAEGELFAWRYGVTAEGNVAADPRGEFGGKNVLAEARSLKETAARFGKTEKEVEAALLRARGKLFKARALRPRPHLDDKVLTDWNALMISSLAHGAGVLGEPRLAAAAEKAAGFILAHLTTAEGTLLHRFRDGAAGIPGFLDDYAFFINALLDLYEAVPEPRYLERAIELAARLRELFEDKAGGGFYLSAVNSESILPVRGKEYYDGALPSGNSMAALCLARLYQLTRNEEYEAARAAVLNSISGRLVASPGAFTKLLLAVDMALNPGTQVVIAAGKAGDPFIDKAAALVRARYLPGRLLLVVGSGKNDRVRALAPWQGGMTPEDGKTTMYVCANRVCLPPVTDLAGLAKTLAEAAGGAGRTGY